MKTLLNTLLIAAMLVVPTLARATPCESMNEPSVSVQASSHHDGQAHPCPHYDAATPDDQQVMVMSDCADMENALVQQDTKTDKTAKIDFLAFAILPDNATSQVLDGAANARAPPNWYETSIPQTSLLLTTQRIRL